MTISCMSVARYRYVVPLLDPHAPQLPVKPGKSRQIVANETAGPRRSGQTGQRPAGISQARCATISAGRREAAGAWRVRRTQPGSPMPVQGNWPPEHRIRQIRSLEFAGFPRL